MKKLKLTALELGAEEVLTRAQLQHISGGQDLNRGFEEDRCRHGSCIISVTGYPGGSPGVCESNSNDQCVCRALNHNASALSTDCIK
ncbi:hypothetical protein [Chitinophaga nivalis]|uniref:Natural product n=1 Tax=Chitinophaga nivalis TaxID=2991709 RepID=A0ABT3IKD1_9BACT|nr:hypothetical protein [Chitinophaga nivalis]MCW3465877.1 hypothetical protein [Chitinophaga nivalis]MCW3484432.1 hypothetical protein [Chitinophaga nivalis]